ncbi:MAG: SHOCT domain-containing protein [Anaerolineae bacterium]|nr:SHOCT domain-containing protein [Anaerolineae bacterium]
MMMGFGFVGGLFMLLFWGGLIALAVWTARELFGRRQQRMLSDPLDPREILAERYARGDISREEYELILRDLM